ncbi:type IX secretion system plug protein [Pedobacter metabolipauper]|nr:DUF5103 domain-containing protein [Pedobacter metabolipauper]
MIRLLRVFFLMVLSTQIAVAQGQQFVYENKVYQPQIRTVQCYNAQKEQSLPILTLKSNEQLVFSFDDLNGSSKNYSYTIEHCTSDWKPSRLSPLDYLDGLSEDRISDYKFSFGTIQKYTHYRLTLPNSQIKPKISGNYLLKVYEEGNAQKPVVSQRFYIVDNQASIGVDIVPSSQVSLRFSNQKINFTVVHQSPIQNPYTDLKVIVMQNGDPLTAITNTKPAFIRPGSILYNELNSNDFPAGNEFRKFDIRSLRYKGANVQDILKDSTTNVILFQDVNTNKAKYTNLVDEDGNFFIRNQEGRDNDTDGDYVGVSFTLNATQPSANGDAYIIGRFNNFQLNEASKLNYDASRKRFYGNILLKQGLYDYKYVWLDKTSGKADQTVFEGSYFETGNTYQVYAYYKRPGSRFEELIGFTSISNLKR